MAPITIKLLARPLEMEIQVGSLAEFLGYAEENKTDISRFLALGAEYDGGEEVTTETVAAPAAAGESTPAAAPAKRGRKSKNHPDPATVSAPAPISAPAAPPTPPVAVSPEQQAQNADAVANGTIPAFLQRSPAAPTPPAAPVAAAAPPPVVPSAPPIAPVAPTPPVSALAPKIIAEIAKRATGAPDGGAGIQGWLVQTAAAYGMIATGATYAETEAVLPFQGDDKLKPIADALSIA